MKIRVSDWDSGARSAAARDELVRRLALDRRTVKAKVDEEILKRMR